MRFVIVGAGIAGISAARAIRETTGEKMGKTEIHIFTEEPYPLYYRPKLIDFLAGEATLESLLVYTPDWYRQQGINLHLGTKVTEVDLASGNVISADGENVPFDSLLLATGARPFVPPIPGLDLKPPIFVLRTAEDAKAVRKAAEEASSVLVLGGGLLGIEAARSLSKLGLSVHVLEQSAHLLKKQLDEKGAEILRAKLESMGLNFLLGKKCEGIEVRPGKRVEVTLEGGEKHAFDMVLVASGVRSRVELASALGCKVERGVVVDDNLATTVSGVFAAGDAAQHRGIVYGIWPPSVQQGHSAGKAMAGEPVPYVGSVASHKLKVAGVDVVSIGDIDPGHHMEEEITEDPKVGVYRRIIKKDGRPKGAILVGDISGFRDLEREISPGPE